MHSNILCNIMLSKCSIFSQIRISNYLIKYSTTTSGPKNILKNIKLQVEILDEDTDYNHCTKLIKKEQEAIVKQASHVKNLKSSNAFKDILEKEVEKLKQCKQILQEVKDKFNSFETFDGDALSEFVNQKYLYSPSNNMYKPIAGFYDYDPIGCRIFGNILKEWEKHFVNKEKMLTVKCPSITSEQVLKASGHVNKFTDYIVKDSGSTESFRLDHTIKKFFENVLSNKMYPTDVRNEAKWYLVTLEGMTLEELLAVVKKFDIKSPVSGKDLVNPVEFNLMFPVVIGQSGMKGYLRPESSQGIFTKFKKLLAANYNQFPFACAQVGNTFRNEINPTGNLLRMREFNIAEIEQFYYPFETKCEKIHKVANIKLWLYSACNQLEDYKPQLKEIGTAVEEGLIKNEYLAYYMARTQQFFEKIGMARNKIRFRQHLNKELAHYSSNCWDCECSTTHGWVECVSLSDRGQFDLNSHASATGDVITVQKRLKTSRQILTPILDIEKVKNKFGKKFWQVIQKVEEMSYEEVEKLKAAMDQNREYTLENFTICREIVQTYEMKETVFEKVVPAVIEPSFGMDRIFYILMEHAFRSRDDCNRRSFLSLPPAVAPYQIAVLPLLNTSDLQMVADRIENDLNELDILSAPFQAADDRIGKRYVKLDQCGVPFIITVDFETITDMPQSVTIRERDSTEQVRVPIDEVPTLMERLCKRNTAWNEVVHLYKLFKFNKSIIK